MHNQCLYVELLQVSLFFSYTNKAPLWGYVCNQGGTTVPTSHRFTPTLDTFVRDGRLSVLIDRLYENSIFLFIT